MYTEAAHPMRRKWKPTHITEERFLAIKTLYWVVLDEQPGVSLLLCLFGLETKVQEIGPLAYCSQ